VTRLFLVFASVSGEGKTIIPHISAETLNGEIVCVQELAAQHASVLTIPANSM
jgi:hypothetical protein